MNRTLLSSIALATVLGTGAALAQSPTTPGNDPYRPVHQDDDDRGSNFGWIGLLGLTGLLGLRHRASSHVDEPMATRTPAGAPTR